MNEDFRNTKSLRSLMPALQNKKYFNYGGQGPLPQPSLDAITNSWEKIQQLGPFTNDVWPYASAEIFATKTKLAQMCGVSSKRIGLTENVTSGCILPLWGLPFSEGDRLLISDCEHPGVVSACKEIARRKHLKIDILNVQNLRKGVNEEKESNSLLLELLSTALKAKTKLVVLSHILWNTGAIMPIKAIAKILRKHPSKPFLLVDAAQSFGQISIEEAASHADIYGFTGHKWACGPEGLGGVAVSERILEESQPTLIGWKSLKSEGSIYNNSSQPFHSDARRFEIATSCIPLLAGLRCSLDLLEKEGSHAQRHKKIISMSQKLWDHLQGINDIAPILEGPPPAGLVSFSIKSKYSPGKIVEILGKSCFWIRVLEDPVWLRACLHVTSTEDEIEDLASAIKNFTDSQAKK